MAKKGKSATHEMDDYYISTDAADFWLEDETLMVRALKPEISLEDAQECL